LLIELRRALEQRKLGGILDPCVEEAGVQDAAAGQGQIGLDRIQLSLSGRKSAASPPKTARSYSSRDRSIRSSTLIVPQPWSEPRV
jgi:hypothetical protein